MLSYDFDSFQLTLYYLRMSKQDFFPVLTI